MKKLLIPIAALAIGCTKEQYVEHPTCHRVYSISEKYTSEKVYMRTDTLWPWGRYANYFCNEDTLNVYRNYKDSFTLCADLTYEKRYYIVK